MVSNQKSDVSFIACFCFFLLHASDAKGKQTNLFVATGYNVNILVACRVHIF